MPKSLVSTIVLILIPIGLSISYYFVVIQNVFGHYLGDPSSIVTFLTALLTYYYVVITWSMVRQMTQAREADRRPYVSVELEFVDAMGFVVVSNHGICPASDIVLSFVPELVCTRNRKVSETIFSKPISNLSPSKSIRSFVDAGVALLTQEAPQSYSVTISYNWKPFNRHYEEKQEIDLTFYRWRLTAGDTRYDKINDNLKEISSSLSKLVKKFLQ
jgi:hypothetical protein